MLDEDVLASVERDTPEWWLLRLGLRLTREQARFNRLERYWVGDPPMPHGNRKMRETYRRLQKMARTNFGSLVAEAILERLNVIGFRAGADDDEDADDDAWRWWQENSLDADAGLVHRAAVVLSRSYVIVGEDDDGDPLVTAEDPRQVIHESSPTNRRRLLAALKTWWDAQDETQYAVLYLPDEVHYFRSTDNVTRNTQAEHLWQTTSWELDPEHGGVVDNPLGMVPVVPFINRPDMRGQGLGEFEDVTDVLDRINTNILDRLVISSMQAYRQRWAKGVDVTDENGNPAGDFDPGADLLWAVPNNEAQFGEFNATDLTPLVKAIESDVTYLSAVTRTPPHYILSGIVNASGDALSVAETGLTAKVRERMTEFGESWEWVYRLVAKLRGEEIGADCEVLWRDPQFRTLAERAAASVQLKGADVPWRTRMRLLDFTPGEIVRMERERAQDAMMTALQAQQMAAAQAPLGVGPPGSGATGANFASAPGASSVADSGADVPGAEGSMGRRTGSPATNSDGPAAKGSRQVDGAGSGGSSRSSSGSDGRGGDPLANVSWDTLYQRAKAAGVKGAAMMTKAQLAQLVGGG